jgi:hypothetical protein
MRYSSNRNCTQLLLDRIKCVKCLEGVFSLFRNVLTNPILFNNSSMNICVLMDLLNAQCESQMCVRDRSNFSTNSIIYKVVNKVQDGVYWNSSQ